jgi:hypothetical protein
LRAPRLRKKKTLPVRQIAERLDMGNPKSLQKWLGLI